METMNQNTKQIKLELQEWMGSDRSIAKAAWSSSLEEQEKELKTNEDIIRVVNMLADSKHSVPFESVVFRFWYRLPISTDRQHMTHRIASHSGMSGRYRTMPNDWLSPPDDIISILEELPDLAKHNFLDGYTNICKASNDFYQKVINTAKICRDSKLLDSKDYKRLREFFRGVLPQNNMTERVSIFNLRSFANYYRLRSKSDAQPEIQVIANLMLEEIIKKSVCPIAISALQKNNWVI